MKISKTKAQYNKSLSDSYLGNPLIEALPQMAGESALNQFVMLPADNVKSDRMMDKSQRIPLCENLFDTIIPTEFFWPLYQVMYSMLYNSYKDRNPLQIESIAFQYDLALHKKDVDEQWARTSGGGCLIVAPSGFGKSTLIERTLSTIPTVIRHDYDGFKCIQITHIFIKIPSDAARKGLMKAFFKEVDRCVGTTYLKDHKSASIAEFEILFETICSTYHIGIIVIDDLQNLNLAKSGGEQAVLNLLSALSNSIGVGIIKIGTPDATKMFDCSFTSIRRATTAGDYFIERYKKEDSTWLFMVSALWSFQWTKISTASELVSYDETGIKVKDTELFQLIYDYSQGVPYLLNFLFVSAQKWAISNDYEKLDKKSITEGHLNSSSLIQVAVEAIRNNEEDNFNDMLIVSKNIHKASKIQAIERLESIIRSKNYLGQSATKIIKIIDEITCNYTLSSKEQVFIKKARDEFQESEKSINHPVTINSTCEKNC